MASNDLIFGRLPNPTGGPVEIVFGDDDGLPPGTVELQASGTITGLRGRITVRVASTLRAAGGITGLRGRIGVVYDVNVERPVTGVTVNAWQDARPLHVAIQSRYEQAQPVHATVQAIWQDARTLGAVHQVRWQQARPLAAVVHQALQQAQHLGAPPVLQRFEEAKRLRAIARQGMQQARPLASAPTLQRFEEATRLRHLVRDGFEDAQARQAMVLSAFGRAVQLSRVLAVRYEEARKPPPGVSQSVQPPAEDPCYVPGLPAHLVFEDLADSSQPLGLVFVCERHGPGPQPEPPQFVIPVLEVYVSVHTLNAVLLPSLEAVELLDATLESDDGGFGWSLTASGPEHLLDQLAPVAGLPARVRITIDGIDWVLAVERLGRTRSFGKHRVSLQGRSVTALLGDPYMPQQSWLNTGALTAEQIVTQALEFTGTTVGWGLPDWLVPAGVWSYAGTPLQAAQRVAESVGAVLRSHRTDARLIFAPRYPVLPWGWGSAAVNVQMPAAVITTDGLDPDPRPGYNAVYVGGMRQGVLGHVRRTGTAGDLLAPEVSDALITHEVAARQRGMAVLGAAGNKLTHSMTLPLLTGGTNPGLVEPGYLIEVNDIGHSWRGLVRGIRITASLPTVRQTITVERSA